MMNDTVTWYVALKDNVPYLKKFIAWNYVDNYMPKRLAQYYYTVSHKNVPLYCGPQLLRYSVNFYAFRTNGNRNEYSTVIHLMA